MTASFEELLHSFIYFFFVSIVRELLMLRSLLVTKHTKLLPSCLQRSEVMWRNYIY